MTLLALGRLLLAPLLVVSAWLVGGLLLAWLLSNRLRRAVASSARPDSLRPLTALPGMLITLFLVSGLVAALTYLPLPPRDAAMLQKIGLVFLILWCTLITARLLSGMVLHLTRPSRGTLQNPSLFANLTKVLVYAIGLLTALHFLGFSILPWLTALGVGGLAVALALQETLANLFAGLQIIVSRQMAAGEYLKLASGEEGTISDISWRSTSLLTPGGSTVIIPNAKLAATIVTNHSRPTPVYTLLIPFELAADQPLEPALTALTGALQEAVRDLPAIRATPAPSVSAVAFTPLGVRLQAALRIESIDRQYEVRGEVIVRLHRALATAGLRLARLPDPVRTTPR